MLQHRSLGRTGPPVSVMSLGSWRTFERISRDAGIAVMLAAREAGITLLDDARYDDETGTAPIRTGWSEVVFGELFREAGWARDEVTICNKLWWEHWPAEDARAELGGSLRRMGLDHVDVIYAIAADDPPVDVVVEQVRGLLDAGMARAWGTGMWPGERLATALDVCDATGTPYPIAAQMSCSLADHRQSADPAVLGALERGGIGLVAAYVLAGGLLTGKYTGGGGDGRAAGDDSGFATRGRELAAQLGALADRWGVPTSHLAFAYALDHPHLATVLFGATSPAQVASNVAAVDTYESLAPDQLAAIHALT